MGSEYVNAWSRLVAEHGLEGAKAIMRERRKLVTSHPGGSFRNRAFAKKASGMRKKKLGSEAEG